MGQSARSVIAALIEGDGDPRYDLPPDRFRVRFNYKDKPVKLEVDAHSKENAVNKALRKVIYSVCPAQRGTNKPDSAMFRQLYRAAYEEVHASATVTNLTHRELVKRQAARASRPLRPVQQDLGL